MIKYSCRTLLTGGLFVALLSSQAGAEDVEIDQKNFQFRPAEVNIKSGDTLSFTNHDNTTHNIQVLNAEGDADDKGLQRPGDIVKHTFKAPGTYEVRCMIHPDMLLSITVK